MHGETFVMPFNRQNIKFLEKLAFIISLFYLSSICAETKYNLFNCPDLEATLQCSSECKIYGKVEFDVLTEEVTIKTLSNKNNIVNLLQDCSIKTPTDWLCNKSLIEPKKLAFFGYEIFQMQAGVFSQQSNVYSTSKARWIETFQCAKGF